MMAVEGRYHRFSPIGTEIFSIYPKREIAFPDHDITTFLESDVKSRYLQPETDAERQTLSKVLEVDDISP